MIEALEGRFKAAEETDRQFSAVNALHRNQKELNRNEAKFLSEIPALTEATLTLEDLKAIEERKKTFKLKMSFNLRTIKAHDERLQELRDEEAQHLDNVTGELSKVIASLTKNSGENYGWLYYELLPAFRGARVEVQAKESLEKLSEPLSPSGAMAVFR